MAIPEILRDVVTEASPGGLIKMVLIENCILVEVSFRSKYSDYLCSDVVVVLPDGLSSTPFELSSGLELLGQAG